MLPRVLLIDGAVNFRDLGGYVTDCGRRVKWRHVFRSGKLDKLNKTGIDAVRGLGIKTLVDLRAPSEWRVHPTPKDIFVDAHFVTFDSDSEDEHKGDHSAGRVTSIIEKWGLSIDSSSPEEVRNLLKSKYPIFLESHRSLYQGMLESLIEGNAPLLFHCAAGKDRTGVGSALLLSLLGVSRDIIREDYLLTQEQLGNHLENWIVGGVAVGDNYQSFMETLSHLPFDVVKPLFDADPVYIEHLFQFVDEEFGNFHNYAKAQLNQTDESLRDLQNILLEQV